MTSSPITVAILAGGRSSRMGTDKSLLSLGGQPIFEHILERVIPLNAPILVIANDSTKYRHYGMPIFPDVIPNRGSLGGLYSALYHSQSDYTLCVACDMPFLNTTLLAYLVAQCHDTDLVVPVAAGVAQPFHAVYSKNCLSTIDTYMARGQLQVSGFYASLKVRWVEEDEVCRFDPKQLSFMNINTPEDFKAIQLY